MDAMKAESVELNGGTGCQEDWIYAGRDQFTSEYTVIKPDARGHGIEAMVVVSATMYFTEQARAIMRQIPVADKQPPQEWGKDAQEPQAR